jgi:hypothetical protein
VNTLIGEHEGAGLKLADEGLILLRCDSKLRAPCDDGGGGGGRRRHQLDVAQGHHRRTMGLKLVEEELMLLFLRCDSTLHEPAIA